MEFEYDPSKLEVNKLKHGISFEEAREMWGIPGVEVPGHKGYETRFLRIGLWRNRFYTCIFTEREGKLRIISVRRSHVQEEEIYREVFKHEEKENEENFS